MHTTRIVLTTVLLGALCASALAAGSRKAGDILVYEDVEHTQNSGGSLPAQAYRPSDVTSTVTIAVTSVDADGGARVHVTQRKEVPSGYNAMQRAVWERTNVGHEFDAKLGADGALLASVDLSVVNPDLSGLSGPQIADKAVALQSDPAYQANIAANEVKGYFSRANVIALGAGKRPAFTPGDAWRIVVKPEGATWDLAVTGKQSYRGHDVVVITAKSTNAYQGGSNSVTATGYYDAAQHLVVGVHALTVSQIQVTGMTSTTTSDLNLKE